MAGASEPMAAASGWMADGSGPTAVAGGGLLSRPGACDPLARSD
jgi:hypothetical protein